MNVEQILRNKGSRVITIRPQLTLTDAAAALGLHHIGALVVSDESDPILGILSERDIVKAIAARGSHALSETVAANMTKDVIVCTGEATLIDILELMTNKKFRHMPVIENERLIGLISQGDIVKYRMAQIEAEHDEMIDYITTAGEKHVSPS
ncbi:CBS domain-containing protein [Microvirga sp. W0021]|uniref:CBS domain-containing protein n=1 Tax=Hohaiivirga grylli TaxID=3133970 RepID=A0ABV0BNX3_9HYPH